MASGTAGYFSISGRDQALVPTAGPTNYAIVLKGRQEWWWQSGPVDLCCVCFPLEAGITVLAGLRVVWNSFLLVLILHQPRYGLSLFTVAIDTLLEIQPDTWQGFLSTFQILVGLVAGLVGLGAGCNRALSAAEFFLWSWPISLMFAVVLWMGLWFALAKQGVGIDETTFFMAIICFLDIFFYVYFIKVSWSYCTVLKAKDTSSPPSNNTSVELRAFGNRDERVGAVI